MKQTLRPSSALLGWVGLLTAIAVLPGVLDAQGIDVPRQALNLLYGALLALLGAGLVDAIVALRLPSPRLQRQLPGSLAQGRWSEAQLLLEHPTTGTLHLRIVDHAPAGVEYEHLPQDLMLPAAGQARIGYRLRPLRRGDLSFEHCEIRLHSRLRLWETRRLLPLADTVRVYPDFTRLHDEPLQGVDNRWQRIGIRQTPRRGTGLEFHQLRKFREGDSLRQIDWKATARHRTPIARQYQDERDQQIVLLLDCGRHMRSQDDALSHFDHALNACLLLSHVALRQGDAVGLATFAANRNRYLAPAKGHRQLNLLLNTVYDLDSTQQPADYSEAVRQLLARHKRRALVIVVTNLRDEDDHSLLAATRQMGRHHRVLVASLREGVLDQLRQAPVDGHAQALAYCGAIDCLNARGSLHERLTALGTPVIDARPDELGVRLVNRYLSWKKAGAL